MYVGAFQSWQLLTVLQNGREHKFPDTQEKLARSWQHAINLTKPLRSLDFWTSEIRIASYKYVHCKYH